MFEVLKVIVESLKGATELSNFANEKTKAKIGVKFFSVYTYLNQVLITGYDIVNILEKYVFVNESRIKENKYPYVFPLSQILRDQKVNIERFALSANTLFDEISILDGKFARDVNFLMRGKITILGSLLELLDDGSIPLTEPSIPQLKSIMKGGSGFEHFLFRSEDGGVYINEFMGGFRLDEIGSNIEDIEECRLACDKINEYLKTYNPKANLKEIESTLEVFRDKIEKNFSLSDILIEVAKEPYTNHFLTNSLTKDRLKRINEHNKQNFD